MCTTLKIGSLLLLEKIIIEKKKYKNKNHYTTTRSHGTLRIQNIIKNVRNIISSIMRISVQNQSVSGAKTKLICMEYDYIPFSLFIGYQNQYYTVVK